MSENITALYNELFERIRDASVLAGQLSAVDKTGAASHVNELLRIAVSYAADRAAFIRIKGAAAFPPRRPGEAESVTEALRRLAAERARMARPRKRGLFARLQGAV